MLRRLARHAFTLLCALSLLLCVAVCVLWVRSHFIADAAFWTARRSDDGGSWEVRELLSQQGSVLLVFIRGPSKALNLVLPEGFSVQSKRITAPFAPSATW